MLNDLARQLVQFQDLLLVLVRCRHLNTESKHIWALRTTVLSANMVYLKTRNTVHSLPCILAQCSLIPRLHMGSPSPKFSRACMPIRICLLNRYVLLQPLFFDLQNLTYS